MIATAPGKLILTGEYAVLDGAPALVVAVNRRVIARRHMGPRGSSPFLTSVADEIAKVYGPDHPATRAALEIVVDSREFFIGPTKLGIGSSAAVTVAATALALSTLHELPVIDRDTILAIAMAAHGSAQSARRTRDSGAHMIVGQRRPGTRDSGAHLIPAPPPTTAPVRGSGADIAAAVHGGVIAFEGGAITRLAWPAGVTLIPFFTDGSADTAELIARVTAAPDRVAVEAALAAIAKASRAACQACQVRDPELATTGLLAALALAANATDQLATATDLRLVPSCVANAREALAPLRGTAKTTGAGGGDVAIAVIPGTEDATVATRLLIEAGCQPLELAVDQTGVDLQPNAQ